MNDLAVISNSNEVTNPLIFGKSPNYIGGLAKNELGKPTDKTEFEFAPCKDFTFKFSKDADCNIDIWIHTNPKNLYRDLSNAFYAIRKIRKYI